MDYERKYKQALERAKEMCALPTDKATIEYIFPELKESEDEKTRKSIIAILDNYIDDDNTIKPVIMNWLEKQGKTLDPGKVIKWLNDQACCGWIEDVEVDKFIRRFKKDFKL